MKKFVFLIFISILFFVSCSKNEDITQDYRPQKESSTKALAQVSKKWNKSVLNVKFLKGTPFLFIF